MEGDRHRDPIVDSITSKFKSLSADSKDGFIRAVPYKIRMLHKEAFSPKHFCIGPFHHGMQNKVMEKHKLRYLKSLLGPPQLKECVAAIQKLEVQTRHCYSEKIDLDSEDFVTMVLVDGAFIIELFLLNHFPERRAADDIIFDPKKKWMIAEVRRDLSLMENQLPFFVLQVLFDVFASATQWGVLPSLLKLAYDFFKVGANLTEKWDRISERGDVKHLLDALRSWYLPTEQVARVSPSKRIEAIPGAKQLQAAGVKFKKSNSNCLFEIKFSGDGELEIPCFELFPDIKSFLRNMTTFESSCYGDDSHFINYVAFLGDLIDTRADAKLLIKKEIIHIGDWRGRDETMTEDDEALANLFNSFRNESHFRTKKDAFCTLRHLLKTYRRTPLHKLKFCIKGHSVSKKKHQA